MWVTCAAGVYSRRSSWCEIATARRRSPEFRLHARIKDEAFARGMACYPMAGTIDGRWGDHVLLAPPYIVTAADVDRIVDILGDAVDAAIADVAASAG